MPKIEYVRLFEQVESQGFDSVQLTCCDASSDEFKLLRVQIQGEILCSPKGVWIEDTVHDLKCRKILELANEEFRRKFSFLGKDFQRLDFFRKNTDELEVIQYIYNQERVVYRDQIR